MSNTNTSRSFQPGPVITLEWDRLDLAHADQARQLLKPAAENASSDLQVDMSSVMFVDSSGLGALVTARKALKPEYNICLLNVSPNVKKLMSLTKLDKVFVIR